MATSYEIQREPSGKYAVYGASGAWNIKKLVEFDNIRAAQKFVNRKKTIDLTMDPMKSTPSQRFDGTSSLVQIYRRSTPGES